MASKKNKEGTVVQDPLKEDPSVIVDNKEFPEASLYFKVYESEADEPDAKIRANVNKLYDHWMEKYGRRWPEDGLNTEDMVWLAEEADKGKRPAPPGPRGVPVEVSEYEDEFIPADPDGGDVPAAPASAAHASKAAGAASGAKPGSAASGSSGKPRRPLSNYEKTVAGGVWVTDEFESADYEAGNLEKLWDMYLWDREGKPTMMPSGPPAQNEGEESEDWDDFYTAYRPRGIDTEEAREAVWATDEFESDEDNTESEWAPEYVGAGLGLVAEDPLNPQYSLRHSTHPLAPFPGEPLKWDSYVYPDFTTYEGLTKQAIPHGMGVMTFGTGTGAGFQMDQTRYGDRYEGEFQAGFAHGLGQFTSESTGEVYVGEFFAGQRHGCGMVFDMQPFYYLMERGVDPVEAYRRTAGAIMRNVEVRTWYRGTKLGDAKEDEVVEINVLKDELDHPFDIALRNTAHDEKLRSWKAMTPREKSWDRLAAIVERQQIRRPSRVGSHYYEDERGRVRPRLDEFGNDTDYDTVDMFQGVDTDGELGLGWDGATDSSEYPLDARLKEMMVGEAMEDRAEEESFKDSVLGNAIINPFTGLNLKTYLDRKESHHNEWLAAWNQSKEGRRWWKAAYRRAAEKQGLPAKDEETESTPYVEEGRGGTPGWYSESEDERLSRLYEMAGVTKDQVEEGESVIRRWRKMMEKDEELLEGRKTYTKPGNPLAPDDTDTGFETDSDMMEMCDMAEILGTVQEARQVVARARMWKWKPEGEVALRFAQDANGSPVNLMQDPLHYPHGTKFMAPGPMGLCHPIPDDPALRLVMRQVADNYAAIYNMYNFDWDPAPGTVQYKIDQRIRRAQELRNNALARYLEAADEVLSEVKQPPPGEGDQQLMLASADTGAAPGAVAGGRPSMFASMSLSGPALGTVRLGYAARVLLGSFVQAAQQGCKARPRVLRSAGRRQ